MTGLILKVRLHLGEQSVLRSGIRPVFWSFGWERCERHQQDRCCSPCGSFWVGLPCLSDHWCIRCVHCAMHNEIGGFAGPWPALPKPIRRSLSQSPKHCQDLRGWRVKLSSSRFGRGLQTALFVIIYHPKILWDFFLAKKPGWKLEDPTTLQPRICCAAVASEIRKCLEPGRMLLCWWFPASIDNVHIQWLNQWSK